MMPSPDRILGFFPGMTFLKPNVHPSVGILAAFVLVSYFAQTDLWAQHPNTAITEVREAGGVSPGKSSAVIGDSGYVVPIPEIKLKSIVGEKSSGKPLPDDELHKHVPTEEKVRSHDLDETSAPTSGTRRLPFDPVEMESPAETSNDSSPKGPPFPSQGPAQETVEESLPTESPPRKESIEKDTDTPWLKPPLAPEDAGEQPLEPKKEVFRKKVIPKIPIVFESDLSKESLKTISLDSVAIEESSDPSEWIPLDIRQDPERVPLQETQPEAVQPYRPDSQLGFTGEGPLKKIPEPEPMQPPESRELVPVGPTQEPVEDKEQAKESIPSAEQESPPAKEHIPSPLNEDALDSVEIKNYLAQTAPILEELSLLMTRAPALTVEDYDPSEASTTIIPQDILLRMNSMKRELQVLDSKTFAVIPPKKYSGFHLLIRQSITQAYQACNAITNYFQEAEFDNFRKAREHLLKAGELIKRTRVQREDG